MTDQPTEKDIADQAMARVLDSLHDAARLATMPPVLWLHEADVLIRGMIEKARERSK